MMMLESPSLSLSIRPPPHFARVRSNRKICRDIVVVVVSFFLSKEKFWSWWKWEDEDKFFILFHSWCVRIFAPLRLQFFCPPCLEFKKSKEETKKWELFFRVCPHLHYLPPTPTTSAPIHVWHTPCECECGIIFLFIFFPLFFVFLCFCSTLPLLSAPPICRLRFTTTAWTKKWSVDGGKLFYYLFWKKWMF